MIKILVGDALTTLRTIDAESVNCCVTSPPYWGLRDYGVEGQIGLEETPDDHVEKMVEVFREVRRVLRPDGTAWVNYGDCYAATASTAGGYSSKSTLQGFTGEHTKGRRMAKQQHITVVKNHGLKPKDLVGMPWRVAFALQADGWWLRSDIIWHKPNPMPESVTDRPTKAHEYIFLLAKAQRYYYDAESIKEDGTFSPGTKRRAFTSPRAEAMGREPSGNEVDGWVVETGKRNIRSVWPIATAPFPGAHFATFPPKLIEPCIKAGCPEGGTVLDPFGGAGTTGLVADRLGRSAVLIELNREYAGMAKARIVGDCPMFTQCELEYVGKRSSD